MFFMSKKELNKVFNLNSYEWWRNHRRVVTFGGFLILFAWYISPVIQDVKNKNICVKNLTKEFNENSPFGTSGESNLTTKEIAEANAYRFCNHIGID